jgi:hypothetical protein
MVGNSKSQKPNHAVSVVSEEVVAVVGETGTMTAVVGN